jgi:threonine dehydrogenase-like Zn-dependent dehydrogenase
VNPFASYAAEEVEWITRGSFADCVLETTGEAGALSSTVDLVARGARIVLCRATGSDAAIPAAKIISNNLSVFGLGLGRGDFSEAVELIQNGTVNVSPLISKRIPLEQAVDELPEMAAHADQYIKVLVELGET